MQPERIKPLLELEVSVCQYLGQWYPPDHLLSLRQRLATPPVVVVDKACGESVLRGAHVFMKGIMGAANHITAGSKVSVWVDIHGTTLRGESVNEVKPSLRFVGNGITRAPRACLIAQADGLGVEMTERIYINPPFHNVFPESLFLQTIPSTAVSHVLDPKPGQRILDMCSAPGGKTSHLGTLMKNEGTVIATEKSKGKISLIKKNLNLLGVTCVQPFAFDATKLLDNSADEKSLKPPFPASSFDNILLDPPCSGLGNRPRLYDSMTLENLKGFSDYQKKLFSVAVSLLKPGGALVYSTCTINPDENEEVVSWALKTYQGILVLEKAPEGLRIACSGLEKSSLSKEERELVLRFDPTAELDSIGFFIAKFRKIKAN